MATWYVWNGHSGTDSGTQSNPFNTNEGIQDALDAELDADIERLARGLDCSTRTVHRNMSEELKREKELLNQQL